MTSTNADCNSATDQNMASPGIRVKDIMANHDYIEVILNLADIKTAHYIFKALNVKMLHIYAIC